MSAKTSNKWKDSLLKTSLPLEYLVADKLDKKGFFVAGEFSFTRRNEQGIDTEFSVDLRASNLLEKPRSHDYWANLNLLIECKYNHPAVKWIFAPHPENSVVITGVINVFQDLCTRRISKEDELYRLDSDLDFCVKGIELHETDANPQSITRGLHQIRWAIPQLTAEMFREQANTNHDGDLHIGFLCPIVVTNAPLYVFRRGLSLHKFQTASKLEDVADKVEALVVYQERGPQLNEYLRNIITNLNTTTPNINERLNSLWHIIRTPKERKYLHSTWDFDQTIDSISVRVLVVTLDAFDRVISKIQSSVTKSGRTLKRVASLNLEEGKSKAVIEPL